MDGLVAGPHLDAGAAGALNDVIARARLALRLGQTEYALAVAQHLLRHVPGHLEGRTLLAQAYLEAGQSARAAREFELLLRLDPECLEAQAGLGVLARRLGNLQEALRRLTVAWELDPSREESRSALARIRRQAGAWPEFPELTPAAAARLHLLAGQPLEALPLLAQALRREPDRLDLRLSRAEAWWRVGEHRRALGATAELLQAAPQCLKAKLLRADLLLGHKDPLAGAALLHEAQGQDAAGVIARELGLPQAAPPVLPPIPPALDLPGLPEEIAPAFAAAGEVEAEPRRDPRRALAVLTGGGAPAVHSQPASDPQLADIQAELDRIAGRLFAGVGAKGRGARNGNGRSAGPAAWPAPAKAGPQSRGRGAELILASREALVARYGAEGFGRIEGRLKELRRVMEEVSGLQALVVYLDDPASTQRYGLQPVTQRQPEAIRAFVNGLRSHLVQVGLELRYLLLIGGDGCLPFYRLPNPVDDYDEELLSDNPYAADDESFLVPEVAVGRLPDGENGDPALLLHLLDLTIQRHRWPHGPPQPAGSFKLLLRWLELWGGYRPAERTLGYSAHIWRDSSQDVYRSVSSKEKLHVCPPTIDATFFTRYLDGVKVAYFNLHGTEDSAAWYGQKDHTFPDDLPLFPVAIIPETAAAADVSSAAVFSEACYGANIIGKRTRESMALSFLAADCLAFFGCTKIAYGTPRPPLGAADVLGQYLLQALAEGLALGDALLQAKTLYAQEHLNRQGHLDEVDQKTLLGFVLYGDPSLHVHARHAYFKSIPVGLTIAGYCPPLVCRWEAQELASPSVPVDVVAKVRRAIQEVDPSLTGSRLTVAPKTFCRGNHPGALAPAQGPAASCDCHDAHGHSCNCGHTAKGPAPAQGFVFSSRETVIAGQARLRRVVRVTTDSRGRIMKMVVSR